MPPGASKSLRTLEVKRMLARTLLPMTALFLGLGCQPLITTMTAPATKGSGVAKEEARELDGPFMSVKVEGIVHATVSLGDTMAVTLKGDDNIVPLIATEVRDGELVIRARENTNLQPKLPLEARIQLPELTGVAATGAAHVTATAGSTELFEARASGASQVTVKSLDVSEAATTIEGASQVTLSGKTRSFNAEVSGASELNTKDLAAATVGVQFSGASKGTVRAASTVRGTLQGASSLTVIGNPAERAVNTSGAASVTYSDQP